MKAATDPVFAQWLSSPAFEHTPESQLVMMVILQAIDDADMRVSDLLIPPSKPNRDFYKSLGDYEKAVQYYKKRNRSVRAKNKMLRDLQREREKARIWLMTPGSQFAKIASTLDIDADVIRDALKQTKHWAGRYESGKVYPDY